MFKTDQALTGPERAVFLQECFLAFNNRSWEYCFLAIEIQVVESLDRRQCLMARFRRPSDGPGGPRTTQRLKGICCYAVYSDGVQSGFEPRVNGKISKQNCNENPQPLTVNIEGQQIRWILKQLKGREGAGRGLVVDGQGSFINQACT